MPAEFDLINRYFRRPSDAKGDGIALGIGDDCALLTPTPGMQLAVSTDTLVEGIHFPADTPPADVGWKSLAVNLSDLAAMGATPRACLLALALPQVDENWLAEFARGFFELADLARCPLVGGDTTSMPVNAPRTMTVTVLGEVPAGESLRRDGARVDDLVCVSGDPGVAAVGLANWMAGKRSDSHGNENSDVALRRLLRPEPRLRLGTELRGVATSAIDVSDGLLGDLAHILEESSRVSGKSLGAEIHLAALPSSPVFAGMPDEQVREYIVAGGDDYELCFTIPVSQLASLNVAAVHAQVCVAVIGKITGDGVMRCLDINGNEWTPQRKSWQHFDK